MHEHQCSSIKDGRYNEQCVSRHYPSDWLKLTRKQQFRLSNSCINHVFYIVEDWQVGQNMEYSGLQIMTAKSQIQVHNRFFLKETHRLAETIDFLATMTEIIASSHSDRDLHIIPTRFLSRSTYSALQTHLRTEHPAHAFLTSFEAYQDLNDKSASKTLREKFARMLLCIKGMSPERVSAVLDEWDTPRGLWEALQARMAEAVVGPGGDTAKKVRGPEMFFADRIAGAGRRKIGDALSKEVNDALSVSCIFGMLMPRCSCIGRSWETEWCPLIQVLLTRLFDVVLDASLDLAETSPCLGHQRPDDWRENPSSQFASCFGSVIEREIDVGRVGSSYPAAMMRWLRASDPWLWASSRCPARKS